MVHRRHPFGTCVISDYYQYIYILIPKCASDTLRKYLKREYKGYETLYFKLSENVRRSYFTFTFLRNPLSRFLSAYNTISKRMTIDACKKPFSEININDMNRFRSFISSVKKHKWDEHIIDQYRYIKNIRFNFVETVETIDNSLDHIFNRIHISHRVTLPHTNKSHGKYVIKKNELTIDDVKDIENLYLTDINLFHNMSWNKNDDVMIK